MQKSSFGACFSSNIWHTSSKYAEFAKICKFREIYKCCVLCSLFVFSQENQYFHKNMWNAYFFLQKLIFSIFLRLLSQDPSWKNVATPKKTTYFARSAQEWPVRKKGLMDLPKLAKIYRKITFLSMFFVNSLHSETGRGHIRFSIGCSLMVAYSIWAGAILPDRVKGTLDIQNWHLPPYPILETMAFSDRFS